MTSQSKKPNKNEHLTMTMNLCSDDRHVDRLKKKVNFHQNSSNVMHCGLCLPITRALMHTAFSQRLLGNI